MIQVKVFFTSPKYVEEEINEWLSENNVIVHQMVVSSKTGSVSYDVCVIILYEGKGDENEF